MSKKRKTTKEQFNEKLAESKITLNDFLALKALWENLSKQEVTEIFDEEEVF